MKHRVSHDVYVCVAQFARATLPCSWQEWEVRRGSCLLAGFRVLWSILVRPTVPFRVGPGEVPIDRTPARPRRCRGKRGSAQACGPGPRQWVPWLHARGPLPGPTRTGASPLMFSAGQGKVGRLSATSTGRRVASLLSDTPHSRTRPWCARKGRSLYVAAHVGSDFLMRVRLESSLLSSHNPLRFQPVQCRRHRRGFCP